MQTAGLAGEKGMIDTEEEGQAMDTIQSLGICPCRDSQSAVACHPPSLSVRRRAWPVSSLFTLQLEGGAGSEIGEGGKRKQQREDASL